MSIGLLGLFKLFFVFFIIAFFSLCEDDEYKKDDKICWTGDHVGEYSQSVLPTSVSSQKYNPEVPFESVNDKPSELYQLSDKLVELKRTVTNSVFFFYLFSINAIQFQCLRIDSSY